MKTLAQALPKHIVAVVCGSLLFLGAVSYAFAKPEAATGNPETMAESSFVAIDADNDGKLTSEEFFKVFPNMRETAFAAIDKDNDKVIILDEWKAFYIGHSQDTASHAKMMGSPAGQGDNQNKKSDNADGSPDLIMPSDVK